MISDQTSGIRGRGSPLQPPNRFESVHREPDFEHLDEATESPLPPPVRTEYLEDHSRTVVVKNDSPDIAFRYSLNPYRGCEHGCAYCYARPTHEYLGLNAGIDFESKIFVKTRAPELLREFLSHPHWVPEVIQISGVTDCYQPVERKFRLTRGCLDVACKAGQPISIVTKNALITRDLDILEEMGRRNLVRVFISITSLDPELARLLEPRTSTPDARLQALRALRAAGVLAGVMVAPIIPGLNDIEVPSILEAAAHAGAQGANYILLRLPLTVKPVFLDWLRRTVPQKEQAILAAIQGTRGGKFNDCRFESRMKGAGLRAEQIQRTFQVFRKRLGLETEWPALDVSQFRAPVMDGQLRLFD